MRQAVMHASMALVLSVLCAAECSAKKRPEPPPDPKLMAVRSISVLPVMDARVEKKVKVDLGDQQDNMVRHLIAKRYCASAAPGFGEVGEIVEEDLESPKAAWLKSLGPPAARWVMIFRLVDATSKITFGSTATIELSAHLFDKEAGELVWKGTAAGKGGQGGLLGMASKGLSGMLALGDAIGKLFDGMPAGSAPATAGKKGKDAAQLTCDAAPLPSSAANPGTPVNPPERPPISALSQVRAIFVEQMSNELDQYIRLEIGRQLADRVQVVQTADEADAVMTGTSTRKSGASAVTGRVGLSSGTTGAVALVGRGANTTLWSGKAGDRSTWRSMSPVGMIKGGGGVPKVARRLVRDLAKALKREKPPRET